MTGFKIDSFSGILPRHPASLLPPASATSAQNCEFAYGELRSTKDGFLLQTLNNAPKSIYTDDGLLFYSWTSDVDAVRSPLSRDTFNRLYYTTPTDFRVTSRSNMGVSGGEPGTSYRVGVPKPTTAPSITVPDAADLSSVTITAKFHYELSGVKYQEQDIALTVVEDKKKYTIAPPPSSYNPDDAEPATPRGASPVVRLTGRDQGTNEVVFDVYSANSGLSSTGDWLVSLARNADKTTYTVTLASSVKESDKETRAYVYTYVNTYNEEGPPSPAAEITVLPTLEPTLVVAKDALTADYAPIKEIRIYRTPTGSDIADYFYVGSIAVLTLFGTMTFKDTVKAAGLNDPIASTNYYPPDPALVGLMQLPNGIMCAWKGNELHFSDAYKPWSWPPAYVKTFAHNIVGGIPHGSGALITTLGQPFLISGVSPDTMTETKLKTPQAGVSKWSLADVGGMIAYASNDGIVVVEGGQATLAYSEQFFTRDVWRNLYRSGFSTMRFSVWDGRLIVYSSTAAFTPFMIRLDEAKGAMTELPGFTAACSFVSPLSDQCYYAKGNALYQFAVGADQSATWQSREMHFNKPINFGFAQVVGTGNWTVEFYSNNKNGALVLRSSKVVAGSADFRLPSGFLSDRWQIKVTGSGRMRELRVAQTAGELKVM